VTFRIGYYTRRSPVELQSIQDPYSFCQQLFEKKYGKHANSEQEHYYFDVCEVRNTANCPQMIRMLRDCMNGRINLVVVESSQRTAKNMHALFYWLYFMLHLDHQVEIIICDAINTMTNIDMRQRVIKATENIIASMPDEYVRWKHEVLIAIGNVH